LFLAVGCGHEKMRQRTSLDYALVLLRAVQLRLIERDVLLAMGAEVKG
jgi:hypothetical protein